MKMVEIIRCSNGHRFPVNRNKHLNSDSVLCPKCREKVKIRRRFKFLIQRRAKECPDKTPRLVPEALPINLFALSMAIKRREQELAEGR